MDFTILLRETAEEALTLSPATQKKEGAACSRPHFINTLSIPPIRIQQLLYD